MPLIPVPKRQEQVEDLWVQSQPGLPRSFVGFSRRYLKYGAELETKPNKFENIIALQALSLYYQLFHMCTHKEFLLHDKHENPN